MRLALSVLLLAACGGGGSADASKSKACDRLASAIRSYDPDDESAARKDFYEASKHAGRAADRDGQYEAFARAVRNMQTGDLSNVTSGDVDAVTAECGDTIRKALER